MMRKILAICGVGGFLLLSLPGIAQKFNVQSASNALKDGKLMEAKNFIDKAAQHKNTSDYHKMWYYRGKVYKALHEDTTINIDSVAPNALLIAKKSMINYLEGDKGWYKDKIKKLLVGTGVALYNEGIKSFQQRKFKRAIKHFKAILDIFPYDEKGFMERRNVAKGMIYYRCFQAADQMGDEKQAKKYLQKLIDVNYDDPRIFKEMARRYLEEGDTSKALNYIEKGQNRYPYNKQLLSYEINIYSWKNEIDTLLQSLTDAIEKSPRDKRLYYFRATIYVQQDNFKKASEDYNKALELDPRYFKALFGLGAMYYNKGVEITKEMDELPIEEQEKYKTLKAKRDSMYQKALPHLKKCEEMKPENINTLRALKDIYTRLDKNEKYKAVRKKLVKLKKSEP